MSKGAEFYKNCLSVVNFSKVFHRRAWFLGIDAAGNRAMNEPAEARHDQGIGAAYGTNPPIPVLGAGGQPTRSDSIQNEKMPPASFKRFLEGSPRNRRSTRVLGRIARSMIGREVSVRTSGNETVRGIVTTVLVEESGPKIMVQGTAYGLGQILTVAPPDPKIP
jgi:hypothetical protein